MTRDLNCLYISEECVAEPQGTAVMGSHIGDGFPQRSKAGWSWMFTYQPASIIVGHHCLNSRVLMEPTILVGPTGIGAAT